MPTVKGGVWTNIEDEVLKAAISKYGLNQWARVSSLLARKTPKQCKARWTEWLDPSIKKIEWSKDEDEKLLHLAKLMPTQWRTIAPIVGRTANQCLERYQRLLDEAEARETGELGLAGTGEDAAAPSADDVRRLRPGELDPDPESKPARPDTIDLDEDEKETLSEARARLANTQGKKAKRKARERQLEESRRVAALQKRRELKMSGINIKLKLTKKGEMDYNADIPFEKQPALGFYDTQEELNRNEKQKEAFDPRKQQLATKRRGDEQDENDDRKRRKNDKAGQNAGFAAAMKAGQMQKIREAEQKSKRKELILPAPQVGEGELDDIIKMGLAGERATQEAGTADNEATRGLVGNYSSNMVGATPIRTPMAPQGEDRIANEIRNIRTLTDTQSALLGGDNADLIEGAGSTGFEGIAPSKHVISTPNPMATPFRQANGIGATPRHPGATPMRTPRDTFNLNREGMQLVGQTPKEMRMHEKAMRFSLEQKLASLPKPKESEWELELPEEQEEISKKPTSKEDAASRDAREKRLREAAELAELKQQSIVVQRRLPRPNAVDLEAMLEKARGMGDPVQRQIAIEAALLIANDAVKFGGAKVRGAPEKFQRVNTDDLDKARQAVATELSNEQDHAARERFTREFMTIHDTGCVPGLDGYFEDEALEQQLMVTTSDELQSSIYDAAQKGNDLEKKLSKLHGGYQARSKTLRNKITEAYDALEKVKDELNISLNAQVHEDAAIQYRLEKLREEVSLASRKEREGQDEYRRVKDELDGLGAGKVNGIH